MVALETMIGLGAMISLGSISMISLGAMFSFRAMICLIEHVSKLERGGYPKILAKGWSDFSARGGINKYLDL